MICKMFTVILRNRYDAARFYIDAAGNIKSFRMLLIERQRNRKRLALIFHRHMIYQSNPALLIRIKAISAADIRPCIKNARFFS